MDVSSAPESMGGVSLLMTWSRRSAWCSAFTITPAAEFRAIQRDRVKHQSLIKLR